MRKSIFYTFRTGSGGLLFVTERESICCVQGAKETFATGINEESVAFGSDPSRVDKNLLCSLFPGAPCSFGETQNFGIYSNNEVIRQTQ